MYPYAVILPAAGSGSRMGAAVPKVLLPLPGEAIPERSVLRHSVDAFLRDSFCRCVVVCAPAEYLEQCKEQASSDSRVLVVEGGKTRQSSVFLGVAALRKIVSIESDMVTLVHDAARACVSAAVIERVIAAVVEHGAATAAVPIVDSVCRASSEGNISEYVERESLWSIQTPQGFRLGDLFNAHQQALERGFEGLDDASLLLSERKVVLVEGDRLNIKITRPEDLLVASMVCSARGN